MSVILKFDIWASRDRPFSLEWPRYELSQSSCLCANPTPRGAPRRQNYIFRRRFVSIVRPAPSVSDIRALSYLFCPSLPFPGTIAPSNDIKQIPEIPESLHIQFLSFPRPTYHCLIAMTLPIVRPAPRAMPWSLRTSKLDISTPFYRPHDARSFPTISRNAIRRWFVLPPPPCSPEVSTPFCHPLCITSPCHISPQYLHAVLSFQ